MSREIQLTRGLVALVDEADYETLTAKGSWCANEGSKARTFYARNYFTVDGRTKGVYMHVLLMQPGPGEKVDHADRDGLNNQRSNLRLVTESLNNANKGKSTRPGLASRFKGVSYRRAHWVARITKDGKQTWLGRFEDEIEAALAYDRAAKELFGECACTNESLGLF